MLLFRRHRKVPLPPRRGSVNPPHQLRLEQDGGGEFLHRFRRHVEDADAFALHQRLGLAHLEFAVRQGGVLAPRAALVSDLLQSLGAYGEAVEARAQRLQVRRELLGVKVVGDERVVRRAYPVLHGKVEAGGGLPAARYADQDHIGLREIVGRQPVVVGERVVHRLDAVVVVDEVVDAVAAPDGVGGAHVELALQRRDEDLEAVEEERVRPPHHLGDIAVHQGADHDGAGAVPFREGVDVLDDIPRLVHGIHERERDLVECDALELREQAVPQHLGGDAGAVGDEEGGALLWHGGWPVGGQR